MNKLVFGDIIKHILEALPVFFVLTILTGLVYPLVITLCAQLTFKDRACGSLVCVGENSAVVVGSKLIGQEFRGADYFHGRPSCTGEFAYNPALSGASNLGPSNQKLLDATNGRVKTFKLNSMDKSVPVDLVTASASGLDPDISVASALIQVERVAKARGISVDELTKLVEQCTEARTFGILGQARVNVLKLNMVLDQFTRGRHDHGRDKARS